MYTWRRFSSFASITWSVGRSWKLSTFEGPRRRSRGTGRTLQTGLEPGGRVLKPGITESRRLAGRHDRAGGRGARPNTGRCAGTRGTGGTWRTTPAADATDGYCVFGTGHPCAGQRKRPSDQSLVAGLEETAESRRFETEEHVQRDASQKQGVHLLRQRWRWTTGNRWSRKHRHGIHDRHDHDHHYHRSTSNHNRNRWSRTSAGRW